MSDHFYPFARNCSTQQPWRCATIPLLLGKDHLDALDYLVYTHGTLATQHGLPYRLDRARPAVADRRGSAPASTSVCSSAFAARAAEPALEERHPLVRDARRSARAARRAATSCGMQPRMPLAPHVEVGRPVRLGAGRAQHPVLPLVPVLRGGVDLVRRELVDDEQRRETSRA